MNKDKVHLTTIPAPFHIIFVIKLAFNLNESKTWVRSSIIRPITIRISPSFERRLSINCLVIVQFAIQIHLHASLWYDSIFGRLSAPVLVFWRFQTKSLEFGFLTTILFGISEIPTKHWIRRICISLTKYRNRIFFLQKSGSIWSD